MHITEMEEQVTNLFTFLFLFLSSRKLEPGNNAYISIFKLHLLLTLLLSFLILLFLVFSSASFSASSLLSSFPRLPRLFFLPFLVSSLFFFLSPPLLPPRFFLLHSFLLSSLLDFLILSFSSSSSSSFFLLCLSFLYFSLFSVLSSSLLLSSFSFSSSCFLLFHSLLLSFFILSLSFPSRSPPRPSSPLLPCRSSSHLPISRSLYVFVLLISFSSRIPLPLLPCVLIFFLL